MIKIWKNLAFFVLLAIGLALTLTVFAPSSLAQAQTVIRHAIPNSTFPIALATEVPATMTTVYLSGQVPSVVDENADPNSIAAFGDTKTQTMTVLEKIDEILTSLDLTMSDVVKMQVFLVGDPSLDGQMDFAGFMEGYTQYFGTDAQPNLPARATMQVARLVNPGWLVEIEVTAVRM
ncbi:RidA family protein [Thermocoleostomius sinensis]|uniref:RidA family protein n=1 Tax=Thermocoleostomius sinensis A174 TaxID=2016057 RepID=A0A9E8ZCD6_9CYAN|nr:RidA family protein [Thermocoleostomius sinensis]WAL58665.1 RidA family protein [Thermocoleostomius sinensis A174]